MEGWIKQLTVVLAEEDIIFLSDKDPFWLTETCYQKKKIAQSTLKNGKLASLHQMMLLVKNS
jgi:hypothetical protein